MYKLNNYNDLPSVMKKGPVNYHQDQKVAGASNF